MALKKDKLITRINNFFIANWWLTGITNVVMIILMITLVTKQDDMDIHFREELDRAMKNTVIATPDGRVALIDKSMVNTDSETFVNHIKLIVKQNFLASESLFTHGFDAEISSHLKSPEKLLELTDSYKLLTKEFFATNEVAGNFIRGQYSLLKKGELPKKATILSSSTIYEPLEGGGFQITVKLKTAKDFINKTNNQLIEVVVDDTIIVSGFIMPTAYSSPLNPFGVKFTSVKQDLYLYKNLSANR